MVSDAPPSAAALDGLVADLEAHRDQLEAIPGPELRRAWAATVEDFLTPDSGHDTLRRDLARSAGLSRPGLDAGLDRVLRGAASRAALDLLGGGAPRRPGDGAAVVILASNLPGLAVQSLLPALAVRRPTLVKSASAEPLFTPAFLAGLTERLPALEGCVAAATWPGGRVDLEGPLLKRAGRVIAYGDQRAIDDLRRRTGDKLVAHGPKISVAWVSRRALSGGLLEALARGLARDIALFDQRGCLSIQAILTDGDTEALSRALAAALVEQAATWPPGQDAAAAAAARQARDLAVMAGWAVADTSLDAGTVIIDAGGSIGPSPGYRTVSIHAVEGAEDALARLAPWRGRLQGVAVADPSGGDFRLRRELEALGVSHVAAPGDLQTVDVATWRNGGLAPLDAFL